MLWTDAGSRDFIAKNYPWFLDTFDNYVYPIQRADAIRYFVLYHYGGIYIDLDIGCLKPLDPLLVYPVILPKTIPVGVSNDLMFSEKGHPMLNQTIHSIIKFDHSWVLNYPTVMFSTGPMFLSAQYGLYTSSHPTTALQDVRILPKSLYGKNAKENEAPHSFFSHFYGSSWHADDAAFIGFLGTWGKGLMWIGLIVLIIGIIRIPSKPGRRFTRGYEIIFPRISRSGRWHFHLGRTPYSSLGTQPPSPTSTESSPLDDVEVPVIHLPFDSRPSTPSHSEFDYADADLYAGRTQSPLVDAFRRVRNRVSSMAGSYQYQEPPETPIRTDRRRYTRGVMFLLPAIFTRATPDIELQPAPPPRNTSRLNTRSTLPMHAERTTPHVSEKQRHPEDIETGGDQGSSSRHLDADYTPFSPLIDLHEPPSRPRTPTNQSSSRSNSLLP